MGRLRLALFTGRTKSPPVILKGCIFVELFLIYLILAVINGFIGRDRLIGFWGFFFISILVTPIIILLFLIISSPRDRENAA